MKRICFFSSIFLTAILLSGCDYFSAGNIQNVGMLTEGSIDDEGWVDKGYQGLLNIGDTYEVDVFYEENVRTEQQTREAVDEFVRDGVNLIFGHSSSYGPYFSELADDYPDVHFVYFNGGYMDENVTSLNFNSHAVGFFAGMVAGRMTEADKVGIIAAYEWQPEIEGFFEGVHYENPQAEIEIDFLNNWQDDGRAAEIYHTMKENGTDVFYPTGDSFSRSIIEQAEEDGLYAIGYIVDQSDIDERTVLTSTRQHVDQLYETVAEEFDNGSLNGSIITYDLEDEVISLGEFSPDVPQDFQEKLNEELEKYKQTGLLPNER
ncbi:BMP family ABC transporter substrate-binding protein [Virgibacillus xinjiangensis]|uniref:BMP family ABC transporter substrate-binding protein n=1 Tax=Virgibacillus xinjiangensis TaxID=393090 RepID=A0ABV7CW62_9BACI